MPLRRFPPRFCTTALGAVLVTGACSHAPPPDFAPEPGLIAQIESIHIIAASPQACPGSTIRVDYEAVLADGSRVPFARSYDKKHPPLLHVVFLERESPDAVSREDGDWKAERDPLATVSTGFRLTARLRARPTVTSTVLLPPDYGCMSHVFWFSGVSQLLGGVRGGDGPDVAVRLALLRSPFYESLYVAGIQVSGGPPSYVLGDASRVPPTGWLLVESDGGSGGSGQAGLDGSDGTPGVAGCPGGAGGQGSNGGDGGAGGDGGSGGQITVVVPVDQPGLAGLVDRRSSGGSGGRGGAGGRGGRGGMGGAGLFDANNRPCSSGADGSSGRDGLSGHDGTMGAPGSTRVTTARLPELFGAHVPQGLAVLLEQR